MALIPDRGAAGPCRFCAASLSVASDDAGGNNRAACVGLRSKPRIDIGSLTPADSRGRCALAIEVVSPDSRSNDVEKKMEHYHLVGVAHYVLNYQIEPGGPRTIAEYRRRRRGWVPLPTDGGGMLTLPEYGIGDDDSRTVAYDTSSGRMLGEYAEVTRMLDEADPQAPATRVCTSRRRRPATPRTTGSPVSVSPGRRDSRRAEKSRRAADFALADVSRGGEDISRIHPPPTPPRRPSVLHLRIGCVILAATILGAAYQDKKDDDKTPKTKPQLPTHYKKLGLRDDQLAKVYKTRTDFRAKSDDLKRQMEKLKADEKEALEKLLTAEQLKRLRELQTGEKSEKPKPGDK